MLIADLPTPDFQRRQNQPPRNPTLLRRVI